VTQENLVTYRDNNTREIEMPDGTNRAIRMTPDLWESLEFLGGKSCHKQRLPSLLWKK